MYTHQDFEIDDRPPNVSHTHTHTHTNTHICIQAHQCWIHTHTRKHMHICTHQDFEMHERRTNTTRCITATELTATRATCHFYFYFDTWKRPIWCVISMWCLFNISLRPIWHGHWVFFLWVRLRAPPVIFIFILICERDLFDTKKKTQWTCQISLHEILNRHQVDMTRTSSVIPFFLNM